MKYYIVSILVAILFLSPCKGFGETYSPKEITEWRRDAAQGKAYAQYNLGMMYDQGRGVRKDYAEAVKWYLLAAQQGNAHAQYNLGVMYSQGQGVRQDYIEALKWYRLAAQQGNADAQFNLGVMYSQGQGVRQNKTVAKQWFGKACDNGDQGGCDAYRKMNEAGIK